ncbi:MAG: MBL fold metallo-hydrolase [Gemmatimonadota bacterium]
MSRLFAIAIFLFLGGTQVAGQTPPPAADAVREALEAMGGEARWRALRAIRVEGVGHEHALEQSERPEGPWLTTYRQFAELRDLAAGRLRRTQEMKGFWQPEWETVVTVADREAGTVERGGRTQPALPNQHRKALGTLDLSPERVLLTALDAPDLGAAGDTLLQGVEHRIVTFTWDGRPARLYLNAPTRLPAAVALPEPEGEIFTAIWGDSPTMVVWSLWGLDPGGWLYPRQRDVFRLGHPLESEILFTVEFDVAAPADSFAIPAELRQRFAAGPAFDFFALRPGELPGSEPAAPVELAPGVVTIPGAYAVTWVDQPDGVVVLEATMTSGWSRAVLAGAAERFPGAPVKAVVSTSDAWPHIGGVREFVAEGVPVYALGLNVPLLERLIAAPHVREPDALAMAPRPADLRAVDGPATIGEGPNRIELYPVRGEGGERMMVAWLPERRILYASDLIQIGPDGTAFWPEYLAEVAAVVEREGLDPETAFAMHTPPMPWERVLEILADATRGTAPPAR